MSMIQSTTNCVRFATALAFLMAVELFLSSAWSLPILDLESTRLSERVQFSSQTRSLPPDPVSLGLELPVTVTASQILLDDTTQDEVVPAEPAPAPAKMLTNQEQSEGGIDHLMRAPMHEAFAEIPLSKPLPSPIVPRQPPEAIEELPPDYKPAGDNIVWIPGFWFWDEEREDFIWVSGVWRDAPEGQQWIEGYWHEETDASDVTVGFRWVNGFWQSTQTTSLNYLPQPPDPLEVGPSMPAPSEDYFYVPGTWLYQQSRYVWRPGYYSVYLEDLVWVPPCYVWTPCGYLFRPGYWDKPIHERGVVFAPVYFREPVYLQPNYIFQPTYIIDTGVAILPHLFVRRNRCHYYFGDWYADRYLHHDFCSWSNLGNHGFYHRQFDPLFNYYNSPMARFHNRSLIHWAGRQHRHCASNFGLRPPTVFNLSIINQQFSNHQHTHLHKQENLDVLPTSQVFLGDSLGRRAKLGSLNALDSEAQPFVRIDAQQQKSELETIDRPLQKQRRDAERQIAKSQRVNPQDKLVQPTQVQIVPTALTLDPTRQARIEKQAIRRQETQLQIQQKQAEAATRAQARKLENDQRKMQDNLEGQVMAPNRQPSRNGRPGNPIVDPIVNPIVNPIVKGLPQEEAEDSQPKLIGGKSLDLPSTNETIDQRVERQLKTEQRQRALQMSQREREQRKQMEAAQRSQEAAQRQAAEALKRQQRNGQVLGNPPASNPSTNGRIDNRMEVRPRNDERQRILQMSQLEREQRKQMEAAQRSQEAAQRQAAEAMKRPQIEAARQAQGAMRQQQAQGAMRQQQAQLEVQQRQAENMRRQAEMQQRQAQATAQRQESESRRAAEKAQRDQQRQQEREKKKG